MNPRRQAASHVMKEPLMNKKVIAREGLIFLATCGAFVLLAMVLHLLFRINLWPLLAFAPFAPIVIVLYVLVRWRLCRRRRRS
jgi:hypothetical protein